MRWLAAALTVMLAAPWPASPALAEDAKPPAADQAPGGQSGSIGVYYDVPELKVNLNTSGRTPLFLKISLVLQMKQESDRAALDAIVPRIIDGFQNYMRDLRPEDLNGSMGIYRMRDELLLRAAALASPIQITNVLFKEMVIR